MKPTASRREVAEQIATRAVGRNPNCNTRRSMCADSIDAALQDRDKRAIDIIESYMRDCYGDNHGDHAGSCMANVIDAIRNEDTNAD